MTKQYIWIGFSIAILLTGIFGGFVIEDLESKDHNIAR